MYKKRSTKVLLFYVEKDYFTVTEAPVASKDSFNALASSSLKPSLTTEGALSTKSLASFKPKPVASRTALITLTLAVPAEVNSTSNSDLLRQHRQQHQQLLLELLLKR